MTSKFGHIVNDIVVKDLTNNVNVNNDIVKNKVDRIADRLVEKLDNPNARTFYCSVGWNLPEATIFSHLEVALKGRDPQKYFSWLCKKSMS